MEEVFFFQYHLKIDKFTWEKLQIMERKYLIDKFISQKESEQKEMEKEARRVRSKK